MFAHEFMRNALLAGSFVAIACGLVGYFVVLRAQVFAGDALSHVAFTGALAAAVLGYNIFSGLFLATILGGVVMGLLGDRARADDVTIGTLFAFTLGLGVLFLSIFTTQSSAGNGTAGVRVLFGSIYSLTVTDVRRNAILTILACALLLAIARPLLFATLDADVAAAQGVPVRLLGLVFLILLGLVAAQASQAVGALLLLGLLAAPAGAAQCLTANPYRGLVLSALISLASVWAGLTVSYLFPTLPPSSMIIAFAIGSYLLTIISTMGRNVGKRRRLNRIGVPPGRPRRRRFLVSLLAGLAVAAAAAGVGAGVVRSAASTRALTSTMTAQATTARKRTGSAPRPRIVVKLIPFPAKRRVETAAYALRHYGIDTWRLTNPHVIVEHYTATESFSSTYSYFASDTPDVELGELPGVCSHFVIDKDGTIYQLVPLTIMCRHTVGLNYTAIGIEHVGTSDQETLNNPRQLHASLSLTAWLMQEKHIQLRNVIGHNESLTSPYHKERYRPWRCQTHADWNRADMDIYRAKLTRLARHYGIPLGPPASRVTPKCS